MRVLRFVLCLPWTVPALLWGLAWGGTPRLLPGLVVGVHGMRGGYARGGTTVGAVWLHGSLCDERRLRHEAVHVTQWAVLGPLLPVAYGLAELLRPVERNPFERWAGLADGGYREHPPG